MLLFGQRLKSGFVCQLELQANMAAKATWLVKLCLYFLSVALFLHFLLFLRHRYIPSMMFGGGDCGT